MQWTAYEMRISDWSSDVCSSDLGSAVRRARPGSAHRPACRAGSHRLSPGSAWSSPAIHWTTEATLSSASADSGSIQPRTLKPLVSGSFGDTTMTSRRIFLRAAIVMGASSFDGSRVMIECGHRTRVGRSEEHTSELQSLMRTSYAVFCLKKKKI